ncbi:hypothetical protein SAMD00023353_2900150 [Rosellinia necatrix]|uniref:Uncharacterized protein n=1 Tax=Rosellinia necatrix TaxID=77044 RepID=A0A1W2TJG4_ROSNE|nr:hypothetical protein SAMD00023353_2900150 [Rosellinia necatrix]
MSAPGHNGAGDASEHGHRHSIVLLGHDSIELLASLLGMDINSGRAGGNPGGQPDDDDGNDVVMTDVDVAGGLPGAPAGFDITIDDLNGEDTPMIDAANGIPIWWSDIVQSEFIRTLAGRNLKKITLEADKVHFLFER